MFLATIIICGFLDLKKLVNNTSAHLDDAEQYAYNRRMEAYARHHPDLVKWARQQIVLVTLSDDTFDKENGEGWDGPPVSRDHHTKVIRELKRAGAKVIAFDIVFVGDSEDPEDDREMAAAARDFGRVVWAGLIENEDNAPHWTLPNQTLLKASPHWANIGLPQGIKQPVINRMGAVATREGRIDTYQGKVVPAFSVETARMALALDKQPIQRTRGGWKIGEFILPVDTRENFNITYIGKDDESFPVVPYEHIYNGAVDDEFYKANQFFRDKIIIIGDTTTMGNDFRTTPLGVLPGVEINAHATATVLAAIVQKRLIREAPEWINFALICLLAALACGFTAAWRLRSAILAVAVLSGGYYMLNYWTFTELGICLHLVAPMLAVLLATLGVLAERGLTEERAKNWMRTLLQRYVSPQIAEYILAHPEKAVLGGEQVTATVLFSDIRGFTKITRQLEPEQTVAMLNDYLQAMTDIVFKHDGTVDKYVGDAVMAVFGAPLPFKDHARHAVATAIDMQSALLELQAQWRAQGLPIFDIGIGINTGEMIAGNMGAKQRLDFTVIGESVNLAAHIEGLNKDLHTRILVHGSTYEAVKDEVKARGPLTSHVKGHEDEIIVYEIFGWLNAPDTPTALNLDDMLSGVDDSDMRRQPSSV